MRRVTWAVGPLVATALALAATVPARAADEAAVARLRAAQAASEGRCEEALEAARVARELAPATAELALLEAQCAMRLRRYEDAVAPLEEARRLDPDDAEATLYLGIARYHAGDLDAAERELDEAVRLLPDRAEARLYRGLVMLERADSGAAALELQRAADLDSRSEPMASYYAGRAWQAARERDEAERALRRVVAEAPGTPWAEEAERALEGSQMRYRRRDPWGRLLAGVEWDSNVVLRGAGVILPTDISDEEDWRGVWFLDGGVELHRDADWAVGVRTGYYGNAHYDLGDFDTQYPTIAPWIDRALSESTYVRAQPDFGYAWVGYDPYLLLSGVNLSLHHAWEQAGVSVPLFRFEYRNYDFANGDPALDRDGFDFVGVYDHEIMLPSQTFLRGGVAVNYYDADGTEYEFVGAGVRLLGRQSLPWKLLLDVRFVYQHQWYDNVSVFSLVGNPTERRDDVFFATASLERPIWGNLKLQARYRYENDLSNVRVYDYDRHIVGGYFVYDFGSP
jgi:tetratricopeptide (TPR) repeat protein